MSAFPSSANPIVYVQFNLQGRWRRTIGVAVAYGLLIGVAIWLTTLTSGNGRPVELEGWVATLTGLQVMNLLIFGAFRVESAVRLDVTSRMLESHRMMPMSPLGSILGYLFGAPMQATFLAVVNFILGSICCSIAGFSLFGWAMLNGVVFLLALFVYSMVAQFSFLARGGFVLVIILGAATIGAANEGSQMLPSAGVLLFPILSRSSVFAQLFGGARGASADQSFGYLMGLGGQVIFTLIAIRVAIRRYLSPNLIGLSAPLGLLMLATWVGLSVVEFGWSSTFYPTRYYNSNFGQSERVAQAVSSFVTSAFLAMFPIAGAARASRLWYRTGDPTGTKSKWHLSEWIIALLAGAIVCLLMIGIPLRTESRTHAVGLSILIIMNFVIGITCLFSWGYLLRRRAWIFAVIWVILTWLIPVIIDGVFRVMTDTNGDATALTAISPAGALAMIWDNSSVRILPGLSTQVMLTGVPAGLLILTHLRRRTRVQSRAVPAVPALN